MGGTTINLTYLKEFLTLAEEENYSEAAAKLFISDSTLSRHILSLESELEAALFYRVSRKVLLTRNGKLLCAYAKQILALHEELLENLKKENGDHRIVVGISQANVQYKMMDKLMEFRDNNPEINFLVAEDKPRTLIHSLKEGEYHFILCYDYEFTEDPDIIREPLLEDVMMAAFSTDHPLADAKSIGIQQLKDEPMIVRSSSGSSYTYVMQLFQRAGITPNIVTHVDNVGYFIDLISRGIGISIVEKKRFQDFCESKVALVDLAPLNKKTLSLFYNDRILSDAERRFISFMKAAFDSQ